MKVKDIISRVVTLYNDEDYVRVTPEGYLKFLDDAINQVILSRPDAHVKTSIVKLTTGTRQRLPEDGYSLIDIYSNKIPDPVAGFLPGTPVFQVDRKDLDYFSNWHGTNTNPTEITEFAYDLRSPRTYWVSPAVGTNEIYVEMDYSYGVQAFSGTDFATAMEQDIPMAEVFRSPLVSYMLYLLYSTDSTSSNDLQVAQRYEASFYQSLGLEYKATFYVVPKIEGTSVAGVPTTPTPAQP